MTSAITRLSPARFSAAVLGLARAAAGAHKLPNVAPACRAAVSNDTCAIARKLSLAVSTGNMLEGPQKEESGVRVEPEYIRIVSGVFSNVRLPYGSPGQPGKRTWIGTLHGPVTCTHS